MLGAYILDVMDLLRPDAAAKLSSLESLVGKETWQERVRQSFCIDDEFVRGVYAQCRRAGRDDPQCVAFLLSGMGCPCTQERVADLGGIAKET
jgi:hypothetical protein